jgi:phospholipase A1
MNDPDFHRDDDVGMMLSFVSDPPMRRVIFAVFVMTVAMQASADILISTSSPRVAPGGALELKLTITNEGAQPLTIDLPAPLHLRLDTGSAVTILDVVPDRAGEIVIQPNEFAIVRLNGRLPSEAQGIVTLTATGLQTNTIALQLDGSQPSSQELTASEAPAVAPSPRADDDAKLVDKPPPLAVSVYEPVYFLIGDDDGLNAKFQISFRYRLFDGQGSLARRLPWIDDLYLSYSQTSLWDLDELSKPFTDSSYRPRLFYANYDLGRMFDGRVRLGVETGAGHESNGKDGDASRSFNMFYVRPTVSYGDPEGFNVYIAPLIHNYIADDENPDLKDYRGYVDWVIGAGSKGGLNFWAVVRKGERSDFGSAELNLSYPLSKLSGGDLTGWLMLQYFGGYGESLVDYNKKLDSQLRLGIAVAL